MPEIETTPEGRRRPSQLKSMRAASGTAAIAGGKSKFEALEPPHMPQKPVSAKRIQSNNTG